MSIHSQSLGGPLSIAGTGDTETETRTNSRGFHGERAHSPVFGKEDSPQSRHQTEESTCVSEGESIDVKEHTKR